MINTKVDIYNFNYQSLRLSKLRMISTSTYVHSDDDSSYISNTRWNASEDKMLKELMKTLKDSTRIWKEISRLMPGKSAIQCRSRWNYKLNPNRRFKMKKCSIGKIERKNISNDGYIITSISLDSSVICDDFLTSEMLWSLRLPELTESNKIYKRHMDKMRPSPLHFSTKDPLAEDFEAEW